MDSTAVDDELLERLSRLSESGDPPPWASSVEGRDQMSSVTFIMVGAEGDRREDLYISRDNGPADAATHDLIAESRNALPLLVAEIRRLRAQLAER
ncbi:hypothetical protein [Ornithinimicrobium cryptoxanthini]|uniref:Uncharacterized protein n=1 Tax=Ornithinimicrobium cryptoxanthini TaxID=2934161 RepID=A0ABY4YLQ3_9MICO|nr:hypothetical protein [Ornithinimicrobium cryptoxanthini]USQ77713.1 hypothetical protein NF557_07395 [Ornithinimicrobium cryptoxanthini]